MPLLHLVALAVIQGVTEFLPVSSSGHLILIPQILNWPYQSIVIDVAVHVGTLGAVLVYVRRDVIAMSLGLYRRLRGLQDPQCTLFLQIVLASLPVIGAGYLVSQHLGSSLRTIEIIAWSTAGFGLLLAVADRFGQHGYRLQHMRYRTALLIGCCQVLALIPGASRSGVTMTAARMAGFDRPASARFSLLLAIPAILGAGTLEGVKLYRQGGLALGIDAAIAAGLAFVTALLSITLMMAWLRRAGFMPFVAYRLIIGGALLAWIYI